MIEIFLSRFFPPLFKYRNVPGKKVQYIRGYGTVLFLPGLNASRGVENFLIAY